MGGNAAKADDGMAAFRAALKRLPRPIPDFANGAACPWCGALHQTITYGENACDECRRSFYFGYPPWHEKGQGPSSWVNFPHREFDALGQRPELLEDWKPNVRLQEIYFSMAEDRLGKRAKEGGPQ